MEITSFDALHLCLRGRHGLERKFLASYGGKSDPGCLALPILI